MNPETATVTLQPQNPGNLRTFIAISEVKKDMETLATLLVTPKRHWSLEEMAECLRSDAKRLSDLENKFNFEKEVFE